MQVLQLVFRCGENGMEKYLRSMDKSCTKHQDGKKETCNNIKHAKVIVEKMKIECTKVKKVKRMDVDMEMIRAARKITRHASLKSASGAKNLSMC
eukprot:15364984-Ditylum_brightwellii.AAC.1